MKFLVQSSMISMLKKSKFKCMNWHFRKLNMILEINDTVSSDLTI